METYNKLIETLDVFVRKYYKNKLIKGIITAVAILGLLFLLLSFSEYFQNFNITGRTIIFYVLILGFVFVFSYYIVIPISKIMKIGKLISHKQASEIIVKKFASVQDKLLNILELHEENTNNEQENSLILASIEKKANDISFFKFNEAIDLKSNIRFAKYLLPLLLVYLFTSVFFPKVFSESTERIINHNKFYEIPSPFKFILQNKNLTTKKGTDFELFVAIEGEYIPSEVMIGYGGNSFVMKQNKTKKNQFSYIFKNINNSVNFNFSAEKYSTSEYEIKVLPSPVLLDISIETVVPEYTGELSKEYKNTTDFTVPQGTQIRWKIKTSNVDSLIIYESEFKNLSLNKIENIFNLEKRLLKNFDYVFITKNKYFTDTIKANYHITIIPDLYPDIAVNHLQDSANFYQNYYRGNLNDDYGINAVTFNYRLLLTDNSSSNTNIQYKTITIPSTKQSRQEFYFSYDFSSLISDNSSYIDYFFQVWDNDKVNGNKSTKTENFEFRVPSYTEIKEIEDNANKNIQSKVSQSMKLAQEIQNDINQFKQNSVEGNMSEWESTQKMKDILEKQKELENLLNEANKDNSSKNELQNKNSEKQQELLEKQKQIEDLMEKVMSDELKELLKQIEDLKNKFNKEQLQKLTNDMELNYKEMEKQLERNLELLKKFEVEQKLQNTVDELKKLAEKQNELSDKTVEKNSDKNQIKQEQKAIEQQFDDIKKEYDKAKELNEALKEPMKLDDISKEDQEIQIEFDETEKQLDGGKESKASKSQKKNSENMKKMGEAMESMMSGNSSEQNSENEENLRQITDNLIEFSFQEEDLIAKFKNIFVSDPSYIVYSTRQNSLKDEFSIIKDSLYALSLRVPQLNSVIQKEINSITGNLNKINELIEIKSKDEIQRRLQEIMTSSNNLALLLSDVLDQMQQQQSSGSGKGKPSNKKGKKPSFSDLKSQQEGMKQQLENLLKQMKEGQGSPDQNAQNKSIAKMLGQQEIFNQMMREMQSKSGLNPEAQKILNEISKTNEQIEKDLVNKKITPQLLERQKEITTRLLEAEKAEQQREIDKKRESKEADDIKYRSPEDYFKKDKSKNSYIENLQKNNLNLKNYYKNLYDQYILNIQK